MERTGERILLTSPYHGQRILKSKECAVRELGVSWRKLQRHIESGEPVRYLNVEWWVDELEDICKE